MASFVSPRNLKKSFFLDNLIISQLFYTKLSGVMYFALTNLQNLENLIFIVNWARYG